LFKDDMEEVGDTCRVRVFTNDRSEYTLTDKELDVARGKAEAFKRGYRAGALAAANAALDVAS